jgi:hypothetical protein
VHQSNRPPKLSQEVSGIAIQSPLQGYSTSSHLPDRQTVTRRDSSGVKLGWCWTGTDNYPPDHSQTRTRPHQCCTRGDLHGRRTQNFVNFTRPTLSWLYCLVSRHIDCHGNVTHALCGSCHLFVLKTTSHVRSLYHWHFSIFLLIPGVTPNSALVFF